MDAQEAKESNDPRNGVDWIQVASLKVATYRVRTHFYLAFGSKQVYQLSLVLVRTKFLKK